MNPELSDLFFNHQHSHFDALWINAGSVSTGVEEIKEAISKDAKEFVENYPSVVDGITAEEFAEDFMRRL